MSKSEKERGGSCMLYPPTGQSVIVMQITSEEPFSFHSVFMCVCVCEYARVCGKEHHYLKLLERNCMYLSFQNHVSHV